MSDVSLEPSFDTAKGLWVLYLGEKLSPGKPREYRKHKRDIDERAKFWKHFRDEGQKAALRAGPRLISDAVHYDELLRDLYGFEGGLSEFMEQSLRELDRQLTAPSFKTLLDAFERDSYPHWAKATQNKWDWYRGMLQELEEKSLNALDTTFWREWLDNKATQQNWTNLAFNDFRNRLRTAYKHSIPTLVTENPLEGVKIRKVGKRAKTVWSLEEVRGVLEKAWTTDREMVPYFALGIFAGLRPSSELVNLTWEDIDWDRGYITVAGEFDNKTGVKRFVPLFDNLRAWLEPWRDATGSILPLSPTNTRGIYKRRAKSTKGIAPSGKGSDSDVMRHTFGSFMDAATDHDRNKIKEWMGHTDFQTYEQHYRNAQQPEEGAAFQKILPPA